MHDAAASRPGLQLEVIAPGGAEALAMAPVGPAAPAPSAPCASPGVAASTTAEVGVVGLSLTQSGGCNEPRSNGAAHGADAPVWLEFAPLGRLQSEPARPEPFGSEPVGPEPVRSDCSASMAAATYGFSEASATFAAASSIAPSLLAATLGTGMAAHYSGGSLEDLLAVRGKGSDDADGRDDRAEQRPTRQRGERVATVSEAGPASAGRGGSVGTADAPTHSSSASSRATAADAPMIEGRDGLGAGTAFATRAMAAAGDAAGALVHLRAALRRERARGRAGHWTYDLARHLRLVQDVRRAEAALRAASFAARTPPAAPLAA